MVVKTALEKLLRRVPPEIMSSLSEEERHAFGVAALSHQYPDQHSQLRARLLSDTCRWSRTPFKRSHQARAPTAPFVEHW